MPRKRTRPYNVEAAYALGAVSGRPFAICPECWSRPSVSARVKKSLFTREQNWTASVEDFKLGRGKGTMPTTVSRYPCSNPACLAVIQVRSPLKKTEGELPWVKKALLSKADQEAFHRGKMVRDVWRGLEEQALEAPQAPVKRRRKVSRK